MYPNFLNDLKSGKMFPIIGAGRLLNIQVILDDKIIYEGPIEEASSDIRKLYYYKTNVDSGKFIFYVDSEMCKLINERNKQTNPLLQ